ncbi:MAG: hypothetical protein CSA68_03190 [Rhodobacterales bacterium]|nr:MAG: hypothetical protein CSA68_03190 [Rhodobacterales bacterium]
MHDHTLTPVDLAHPEVSSKAIQTVRQMAIDCDAVLRVLTAVPSIDAFNGGFSRRGIPKK